MVAVGFSPEPYTEVGDPIKGSQPLARRRSEGRAQTPLTAPEKSASRRDASAVPFTSRARIRNRCDPCRGRGIGGRLTRRLRRLANSYDPWRGQGGGLPYKAQGLQPTVCRNRGFRCVATMESRSLPPLRTRPARGSGVAAATRISSRPEPWAEGPRLPSVTATRSNPGVV